jgi:hypothetical protein
MTDLKITEVSDNVFAELGFGPQESQNLLLRSQTMIALVQWFNASGLTQPAEDFRPGSDCSPPQRVRQSPSKGFAPWAEKINKLRDILASPPAA